MAVLASHPAHGLYSAAAFADSTLLDLSGNRRHAERTAGAVSIRTESGSGASNVVTGLAGTTTSKMLWPAGSIPSLFTVCSVTRYDQWSSTNPARYGRILNGANSPNGAANWLHGHYAYPSDLASAKRGPVFYGDWNTRVETTGPQVTDWLVLCGTNDVSVFDPGNIINDQVLFQRERVLY